MLGYVEEGVGGEQHERPLGDPTNSSALASAGLVGRKPHEIYDLAKTLTEDLGSLSLDHGEAVDESTNPGAAQHEHDPEYSVDPEDGWAFPSLDGWSVLDEEY